MGPYPCWVRRNAPCPFARLSPPPVSLVLRAAQPLNDKPMSKIDDCRIIVRSCVDPQEKLDTVPGWSGFLKRAQDSMSSRGGVAFTSEPQPISVKRIWLEFHVVRSGVDTEGYRYCSRVFGTVAIQGIHELGIGPYPFRVRRKGSPLMGLYPSRTAVWSSSQSATSQRDGGFLAVQRGVDPRKLRLLPP